MTMSKTDDAPGLPSSHDMAMRSQLSLLVAAFLSMGCGDDARTSSWTYGSVEAGADRSGDHDLDQQQDDALDASSSDAVADVTKDGVTSDIEEPPPYDGPTLYPTGRTHSPLTPFVADRLRDVVAKNPTHHKDRFLKIGDSITVSPSFLYCFADAKVDLGEYAELQDTLEAFASNKVEGKNSFARTSTAAMGGKTASWAMSGKPSPVESEMEVMQAAAAVVMFGTNDIGWFADDHVKTLRWYSAAMFDLVDKLMGAGVVPILSTIPPRDDNPSHDDWVSLFNGVIRGMAQGRQVPLVDYHRKLMPLSSHGLSGDGVHPNAMSGNACVLTDTGLAYGYNVRNAITLQALDRIRRSVFDSETAPDEAVELGGQGTITAPFVITDTVFADVRSTLQATNHGLDVYDCSAANESGPEFVYRLEVQETKRLRAVVLTRGDVDVDLHLLGQSVGTSGCLARGDTLVEQQLAKGTYHLVVDTFVRAGQALAGEYLLAVELR